MAISVDWLVRYVIKGIIKNKGKKTRKIKSVEDETKESDLARKRIERNWFASFKNSQPPVLPRLDPSLLNSVRVYVVATSNTSSRSTGTPSRSLASVHLQEEHSVRHHSIFLKIRRTPPSSWLYGCWISSIFRTFVF